jgi:hypothetical protein
LVSQSRVLSETGAGGSDDLTSRERRDQPTTKAMAYKNDANDGSGQRRAYHGEFDYVA